MLFDKLLHKIAASKDAFIQSKLDFFGSRSGRSRQQFVKRPRNSAEKQLAAADANLRIEHSWRSSGYYQEADWHQDKVEAP